MQSLKSESPAPITSPDAEDWVPSFSPWRHGGWYVSNVQYPSGSTGCVSQNYEDGKWRIVCDPRRNRLGEDGDYTFPTREAAARAERELAQARFAESAPTLNAF